jgi:AI-2 transport protein TqsA
VTGTGYRAGYPRGTVVVVGLAAAVVVGTGVSALRDILAPVLLTLVLTICANPVRTWLEKRGVAHGLATGSVILVVFLLLAGFAYTLVIAFAQFTAILPDYADELAAAGANLASTLSMVGVDPAQLALITDGFDPSRILAFATGLLGSVFSITGALVIVLTMLIVMSADATYTPTVLRLIGNTRPELVGALGDYATNVRRYMLVTTVLGVAQGVLCTVFLLIVGVPAALLWGLLMFLCSFIPNIGYFIAIVPPLFFGFLVGGWPAVIAVVVVYGVINSIVQTIIQPRAVSTAVSISQSLTFFSVLVWATVLGPLGAILAIPLTLLVRAVLIDANPDAHLWRPAIGDISEAKRILKAEDLAAKDVRLTRKATKATARRK